MAFRIGRKFAQHVYPEPPRGWLAQPQLARNFATATGAEIAPVSGLVTWTPDVGSPDTAVEITPVATGVIEVSGILVLENESGNPANVSITVEVDGVPVAGIMTVNEIIPDGAQVAIPFLAQIDSLALGVAADVEVRVGTDQTVEVDLGQMAIQEVPASTG